MKTPSPLPKRQFASDNYAGVAPEEAVMVGDRLETDIEMGRQADLWTCLVLTGISTAEEAEQLSLEHRPHWIIDSIADLPDLLRKLKASAGAPPFGGPAGGEGLS